MAQAMAGSKAVPPPPPVELGGSPRVGLTVVPNAERFTLFSMLVVTVPGQSQRRMLSSFGYPLLFTLTLAMFASMSLYRSMRVLLRFEEDFNSITAKMSWESVSGKARTVALAIG